MSRADDLIGRLQAEIVKRDARIAELMVQCDATYRNFLALCNRLIEAGELTPVVATTDDKSDPRFIAGYNAGLYDNKLKAQQPSAGVVLPELHTAVFEAFAAYERFGTDCLFEGVPMIHASVLEELAEVARLNPCRAQSVPALMALREAITPEVIDWLKCGLSTNGRLINGTHPALEKLKAAILAAAPSAQQKESGDE